MKILEQTPDRLVLRHRPLGWWIAGGIFALVGLLITLSGEQSTLRCDRIQPTQGTCQLSHKRLLSFSSRTLPLEVIEGATVNVTSIQKTDHYTVILQTQTETIGWGELSTDRPSTEAIAAQINAFLNNPNETTLLVQQDGRLNLLPGGSLVVVIGVSLIIFATTSKCVFDKPKGSVWIHHQRLFHTQTVTCPLDEIERARLSKSTSRSKGKTVHESRIVLVLKSDKLLPLTSSYMANHKSQQHLLEQILVFLASAQTHSSSPSEVDLISHLPSPSLLREQKAIAQLKAIAQHNPNDADAHYRLGMALYRSKQAQAASESLNTAKALFTAQNNAQKVMEVQEILWDLQLEPR
ncbi:MAG: tetratricopeptide repeat protein [Oculatellaceae cyanobacterium bins.114]|nr:tetratricopeptide repeat protein [Oculatellaceae cyanobacterium bins.114]